MIEGQSEHQRQHGADEYDLSHLKRQFQQYLCLELGRAPETARSYLRALRYLERPPKASISEGASLVATTR